jgi:tRNA dimethylallyltransferase
MGVPHHLLDIVPPENQFTAAEFSRLALESVKKIHERRRLPIITGGTGLYLTALLKGLFPGGDRDDGIRKDLEREEKTQGLDRLFRRLEEMDPVYAEKVGSRDRIRILRALEVQRLTGKSMTENFAMTRSPFAAYKKILIGLRMDRTALYARIEERVDSMFARGLVEETRNLIDQNIASDAPPFRALGYRQVVRFLEGRISLEEAIEQTKTETRHYAKRQMTWFRKMEGIRWFSPEKTDEITDFIQENMRAED